MNAPRYVRLAYSLLLVLLVSTTVPCDLVEIAAASCCEEAVAGPVTTAPMPADDAEGDAHVDCCTACLTCCAMSTEALVPQALGAAGAAGQPGLSAEHGTLGVPLPTWRPPRG